MLDVDKQVNGKVTVKNENKVEVISGDTEPFTLDASIGAILKNSE